MPTLNHNPSTVGSRVTPLINERRNVSVDEVAAYDASFAVGQRISIRSRPELEESKRSWSFHNPLADEQLSYADKEVTVAKIGYYHGGDVLYTLSDVPGIWHEQCLQAEG